MLTTISSRHWTSTCPNLLMFCSPCQALLPLRRLQRTSCQGVVEATAEAEAVAGPAGLQPLPQLRDQEWGQLSFT